MFLISFILGIKWKKTQLKKLVSEIKSNTKLGSKISSIINSGELVSDDIVSNLIEKFISDSIYKNKLIFDGYPRNLNQAKNSNIDLKEFFPSPQEIKDSLYLPYKGEIFYGKKK